MFETIIEHYCAESLPEIERWINEWAIDWTIQTICDVRRSIEDIYWVGTYSNQEIVNAIVAAGWVFTNRLSSDTWDMCCVNIDTVAEKIAKLTTPKQ